MNINISTNGLTPKTNTVTKLVSTGAAAAATDATSAQSAPLNVTISPLAVARENASALQNATPDVLAQFLGSMAGRGMLTPIMNFSSPGAMLKTLLADDAETSQAAEPAPASTSNEQKSNSARIITLATALDPAN